MFMAKDSGAGNYKSIFAMLPLDKSAPTIPLLSVLGKLEEMVTRTNTVCIIGAMITVKSRTILSSPFHRGERNFLGT